MMRYLFQLFMLTAMFQCAAPVDLPEEPVTNTSSEPKIVLVEPRTINEQKLTKSETVDVDILSLARNLIEIRRIARRSADLRTGPGIEFNLQDQNLIQGETVVVLERSVKWLKVSNFDGSKIGWIHKLALGDPKLYAKDQLKNQNNLQKNLVQISSKVFPTVFAASAVQQVYSYSKKEIINISIPRGTSFKMLREENGKKLLWFSQKNLLFWGDANEFL